MSNYIGNVIKSEREKLKLTTFELAEKIGISQSYLSQIENGKRKASEKILASLKDVFEFDFKEEIQNHDREESKEQRKIITGVAMTTSIGVTEIEINIRTKISDKINEIDTDEEIKKIRARYAFETSIIVQTITEFLENQEKQLKDEIIHNLNAEIEKIRNDYIK
ncbi:transcriptional regulator with XRE-family HTH domain [Fontibacillus solani]|uniref:Transcriptional regulator with XRE-family HTH domain n=1 Tax=Fontibacillus solani TaxID=1572857 RepID=A0A7W3SQV0_9BACL|nr:helix-turn-helix transcriptional regulator [Fontibacillus solani]MBA9084580.1 transcriptional regulator with XRE-family HTH domain [Fontibacillus solani]